MRSRNTLHVNNLHEFKAWLTKNDIVWRIPEHDHQVLQIKQPKNGWTVVYGRADTNAGGPLVHYTTYGYGSRLVQQWLQEKRTLRKIGIEPYPISLSNLNKLP